MTDLAKIAVTGATRRVGGLVARNLADAGMGDVVYTSFFGAAPDATFTFARDHWATEQHLIASGMNYTLLRNNLYLDLVLRFDADDGVIRGPDDLSLADFARIVSEGVLVFPLMTFGFTLASATRRCATPWTRIRSSTTLPIAHVPVGW